VTGALAACAPPSQGGVWPKQISKGKWRRKRRGRGKTHINARKGVVCRQLETKALLVHHRASALSRRANKVQVNLFLEIPTAAADYNYNRRYVHAAARALPKKIVIS
jgi:hypothetical protein